MFRIFHEIGFYEWQAGRRADIAYVIDQGHNLKGTIEAMIQTVAIAQALFAKAALVDYERLSDAQRAADLVRAESCLQDAFATDVRPAMIEWRRARGLPDDPLEAFRASGYLERVTRERAGRAAADPPRSSETRHAIARQKRICAQGGALPGGPSHQGRPMNSSTASFTDVVASPPPQLSRPASGVFCRVQQ